MIPKTMKGKDIDQWVDEYSDAHQNGFNQVCHTFGIPMIVLSLLLIPWGLAWPICFKVGVGLFVLGWILQFAGHAVEGKPPEFFRDWRFLFVGVRWWLRKIRGK